VRGGRGSACANPARHAVGSISPQRLSGRGSRPQRGRRAMREAGCAANRGPSFGSKGPRCRAGHDAVPPAAGQRSCPPRAGAGSPALPGSGVAADRGQAVHPYVAGDADGPAGLAGGAAGAAGPIGVLTQAGRTWWQLQRSLACKSRQGERVGESIAAGERRHGVLASPSASRRLANSTLIRTKTT
jgi:hypothetical protein